MNPLRRLLLKALTWNVPSTASGWSALHVGYSPGQPVYSELTLQKAVREGYTMSIAVYRAVRAIAQAASSVPWVASVNGENDWGHPLTKLLASPNPEYSGQDMIEVTTAHLLLCGNALWQPLPTPDKRPVPPVELWPCQPDMIQPIPSRDRAVWLDGWQYSDPEGRISTLPRATFIHLMRFNPANPYWGIGDLQAAARTIDADNEAQDTQKISMQNRGMPDGVFSSDMIQTQDQHEEAVRQVRELYLQKGNRRAPWVLGGSMKWTQMSLTPVEMDFIKSRIQNKRDIAAAFGVDPWWIGDREHSSYNNVAEARRSLYEDTVLPLLDDVQAMVNLRLVPLYQQDGLAIGYDTSGVAAMRNDYGMKVDQAQKLFSMGVPVSQISERLELGIEEFPGWDNSYMPFSLAPVGASQPEQPKARGPILTEEQKALHWKLADRKRAAWIRMVTAKVRPLYEELGREMASALRAEKSRKASAEDDLVQIAWRVTGDKAKRWEAYIASLGFATIEEFGGEIARALGGTFNPQAAAVRSWLAQHAAEQVETILGTQKAEAARLIRDGVEAHLSNQRIAQSLQQFYTERAEFMAERVARTETAMAAGYGQHEAALASGATWHMWLSTRDDRTRDEHIGIDGETVDLGVRYSNGMLYPGDPAGGPENVINCRCTELFG